jgi:lysozyme
MNVSSAQLNKTAGNEGFVAKAYKDGFVGGIQSYSIGYGHQIQPNEQNLRTATLTKAQGLALLQKDSKNVVDYINAHNKRTLNQGQFDAFFDYGYNAGVGALQDNILSLWNSGATVQAVANALQTTRTKSHNTSGVLVELSVLVKRRTQEAETFVNGHKTVSVFFIIFLLLGLIYYYADNNIKIPYIG